MVFWLCQEEVGALKVRSLGQEDPLEEGLATHSSIPAWRIPWTEETGGLVHGVTESRTRLTQHSRSSRARSNYQSMGGT